MGADEDDWMLAGFDDSSPYCDDGGGWEGQAEAEAEAAARRHQEESDFEALRAKYGFSNKRPGRCHSCGEEGHWSSECPRRGRAPLPPPARLGLGAECLAQQQRVEQQYRRGVPRLVQLLRGCLESTAGPGYEAYLCCPLQHFGAGASDRGWGCGWRNIQMLSSALLLRSPQLREALYGGAGFVPDIGSMQAWLEAAWAGGFDLLGADSLGGSIQGDRKWIGTTEAAALLRSFGVKAQIVDFEGHGSERGEGQQAAAGSIVRGPDGLATHLGVECDLCGTCPIRGVRHRSASRPNFDLCAACRGNGGPEVAAAAPYVEMDAAPQPAEPAARARVCCCGASRRARAQTAMLLAKVP
ncbi:Zinc finger with UFM1-specific peptidase domain protein [Tetrabaena socialis]|uniref:Zinc finger with UFM1-specific peptidase domain protein n=1 Tax=Tetrabaena socialis TaxID=47790 RepID=A0A2J8A6W4_9CHLO|nr:Zinc finger with UFM1-specific peptidase domain protein [Tetrabaena socialis]|eukprot:PNH08235.1 Zinc finger with UFM1-specific peptidase domain protein [Tetrabaena socialis]